MSVGELFLRDAGALHTPTAATATVQPPPEIARDQRILSRFVDALHGCGVVGEDRNGKLIYLAITSRLGDEPVSEVVKGLSSSGKSYVVDAVMRFFPEDAYIEMTAMSERALVYDKRDFAHRTIVLFEAVALREQREKTESNLTAYFVRSLLSEGRIRYPVTVKDKDGNFTTKVIEKNGPTNMILSTTATSLHGENETRMISLPTNDSPAQTKAVLRETARRRYRTSPVLNLDEWRGFQAWLSTTEHRVDVPYADYLADGIAPTAVRLRRDFNAILGLIEAHAILHQLNRERDDHGRIVASWEDYAVVRELVVDLISEGVGATVSETVRETVKAVSTLADEEGVTGTNVAAFLGLDKSAAYRRLQVAREKGYIVNLEDRRGRPGRYVIGDSMPEERDLLPQPRNPEDDETAGQAGGCTVAGDAERVMREAIALVQVELDAVILPDPEPLASPNDAREVEEAFGNSGAAVLSAYKERFGFVPRDIAGVVPARHLLELIEDRRRARPPGPAPDEDIQVELGAEVLQ